MGSERLEHVFAHENIKEAGQILGPKDRKTEVTMWESALVNAILVDLDFAGR